MRSFQLLVAAMAVLYVRSEVVIEPSTAPPGSDISIECKQSLQPGHTIAWYKKQLEGEKEVIGYNNIKSGAYYRDQSRFTITGPANEGGVTIFTLLISGALYEDSGDYMCSVEGSTGTEMSAHLSITHDMDSLEMYSVNEAGEKSLLEDTALYHVEEGSKYVISCEAKGSNPKPDISITFDDDDLTDQFQEEATETIESSGLEVPNMDYIKHDVTLTSTNEMLVSTASSRVAFTCRASVGDYEAKSITVRPVLRSAPTADCWNTVKAGLNNRDVVLACVVDADPEPDVLRWQWTDYHEDEQKLEAGDYIRNYRADRNVLEDGRINFTLTVEYTYNYSFDNYTMVTRNDIGAIMQTVRLEHDSTMNVFSHAAPSTVVPLLLIFLATFLALFNIF